MVVEGTFGNWTAKVSHTVTEYKWRFEIAYEIVAFRGTGEVPEDVILLQQRSGSHDLFTKSDKSVRPAVSQKPNIDVDISWLFQHLQGNDGNKVPSEDMLLPTFAINRHDKKCFTPRRNKDTDGALDFLSDLHGWCGRVHHYFLRDVFPIQEEYQRAHRADVDTPSINTEGLFVPILPIFVEESPSSGTDGEAPVLAVAEGVGGEDESKGEQLGAELIGLEVAPRDVAAAAASVTYIPDMQLVNSLLREEQRVLHDKFSAMDTTFPPASNTTTLISAAEGRLLVSLLHTQQICQQHVDAVDYIEDLLRQQLVAAIGKEVKPSDFAGYMRFHNNKLFQERYRPKPFCYAVRRSEDHAPEGVLSIEEQPADGSIAEPIYSLANRSEVFPARHMNFTLNAATTVRFSGEMFLHAYMRHEFHQDSSQSPALSLRAEARQFSSFIVLIGRMSSATSFDPKYAMIVQNKDDIKIPLDMETIPSAKEFKDAISSLSPEQQRFAKAFRGMQLESTLFGVLVIQIKPQLEKVLNLPPDSLTKEIQLTQDLMEMFIKYQIPSDLLSYSSTSNEPASIHEKLEKVKGHVQAIQTMISVSKEKEIAQKKQEAHFRRLEEGSDDVLMAASLMRNECVIQNAKLDMVDASYHSKEKKKKKGGVPMLRSRRKETAPMMMKKMDNATAISDNFDAAPPAPSPGPSASPAPTESSSTPQMTDIGKEGEPRNPSQVEVDNTDDSFDCTKVPQEIDSKFEALDKEGAVRPTIINVSKVWSKRSQKALLDAPQTASVDVDSQKKERDAAFDLLDALSKSGGLNVEHAQMHIVIAATHCFDKNLMDTIVQSNVNPIEKVEMSTLIMASTIHKEPVNRLVAGDQLSRVMEFSPDLLQIADAT